MGFVHLDITEMERLAPILLPTAKRVHEAAEILRFNHEEGSSRGDKASSELLAGSV